MPIVTIANAAQQMTMAGVWIAAIGIIGLLIRQILPWKKQAAEAEAALRADLIRRVEKLERLLDRKTSQHEAERSLDRHQLANVTQCFDALLLLVETSPDKAVEIVIKIKAMRQAQMIAEAEEKAIIRAAMMTADRDEMAGDGQP